MAHIDKRRRRNKDGTLGPVHYRVRYRDPDDPTKEKSQTFKRLEDARRHAATTEASIVQGSWVDPAASRSTFAALAADWLASKPHKRATTVARDRTVLDKHVEPVIG